MSEDRRDIFPAEFHLLRPIGQGGTAELFLAEREGCAGPVVLKLFFDPAASTLVEKELTLARLLPFPGFVRVYGAGVVSDGRPFLWMEYCDGPLVEDLAGRFSEEKLLSLLSAISASLYVLHMAGYLHNDLKPSNMFCPARYDQNDFPIRQLYHVKVLDMSLARALGNRNAEAPTGTVGFMSPEMILKRELTPASDLFSLGVIAYYLACGRLPFVSPNNDPLEINAEITEGKRPRLDGPAASFSLPTRELIQALLAIDPKDRPSSALGLMEHLAKIGSPYPFRNAVRPRHLLGGCGILDRGKLTAIFGEKSFSQEQLSFIERATAFDPAQVRLLLEHNFDHGNFARLDGHWGWKTDDARQIVWSHRNTRLAIRALAGAPVSFTQYALALALLDDDRYTDYAAEAITGNHHDLQPRWDVIPVRRRAALLYSLRLSISGRTRKILAKRLVQALAGCDIDKGVLGRLQFEAGNLNEAIGLLVDAADAASGRFEHDIALSFMEVALTAADKLEDIPQQGNVLLRKARIEKEIGLLPAAESSYQSVISRLDARKGEAQLVAQACKGLGDVYKSKSDYQAGILALDQARELYVSLGDQLGLSHTLNNLGNIYWIAGKLDEALDHYMKALVIQKELGTQPYIASTLNNIGTIYIVKGQLGEAIMYLGESLAIKEQLGDKGEIARTWNNLGGAYFMQGNISKAVEAFTRSLENNREVGAQTELVLNIENLAESMIQAGQLTDALSYLKEGAALAQSLEDTYHLSMIACLTGQLWRRMGCYDESERQLLTALELARKINHQVLLLSCYIHLGRLYLALKEYDAADKYLADADESARHLGDANASFHLALIHYQRTGDDRFRLQAEEILQTLNTPREAALYYLTLLEANNQRRQTAGSGDYIKAAGKFFDRQAADIDLARLTLARCAAALLRGDSAAASAEAQRALELAAMQGLMPEQWLAAAALSEIYFGRNDFELAFQYARQATEIIKKIATHLEGGERLGRFYNDERIRALLGRIKSLQSVLAKRKGAAVGSP